MRWMIQFSVLCLGVIALVLGAIWYFVGPTLAEVPPQGIVALVLTLILTAGLAVGLMALVFFSARTNRDAEVSGRDDGRRP